MAENLEKQKMIFLTLQFLRRAGHYETLHQLESDSGLFFDMNYFGEILTQGKWEEAEKYLSGFTKVDENLYSLILFYDIRKQKYLEALDKGDHDKAVEILQNELKVFSTTDKQAFVNLTFLLTLDNIREYEGYSRLGDTKLFRDTLFSTAKILIETNPVFWNKLELPCIEWAKFQTLVNRSLDTEQASCTNKSSNPFMKTVSDNTYDQCVAVGDAKGKERKGEREELGKLLSLDVRGIHNTNPDQQNVVKERREERGNGEETSSSNSNEVINTNWDEYIACVNIKNRKH